MGLELEYKCIGKLKDSQSGNSELIVFSMPFLNKFELAVIVTVPGAGETTAPVYVKIREKKVKKNYKVEEKL